MTLLATVVFALTIMAPLAGAVLDFHQLGALLVNRVFVDSVSERHSLVQIMTLISNGAGFSDHGLDSCARVPHTSNLVLYWHVIQFFFRAEALLLHQIMSRCGG